MSSDEVTAPDTAQEVELSSRVTYNWQFVYNLALFALHKTLTGHKTYFSIETGRPSCVDCYPTLADNMEKPTSEGK